MHPADLHRARKALAGSAQRILDRVGAAGRDLTEQESAAVNGLLAMCNVSEKIERVAELNADLGIATGVAAGSRTEPLSNRIAAGLDEHRDLLLSAGRASFTVRAAASDPVTTSAVGTTVSLSPTAPNGPVIGAQSVIPSRSVSSATSFSYPRYSSVEGAAAVQAAEGDAKAQVHPVFTLVEQPAITIAGFTKMSRQALSDEQELSRVVDGVLRRSLGIKLDSILVDGNVAPAFTGYEPLAGATTSLVYTSLVDAVSEEVAAMQIAGYSPSVVLLNPADWLASMTAKASGSGEYLSGSYLGSLPSEMRGLRVGLSPSVTAGKALLVDTSFNEYLLVDQMQVVMGLDGNDFTKNMVTLLAEMRVVPLHRAVGSLRLVTPKA